MILSHDLNRAILRLAPRFIASDYAPSTYPELCRSNGPKRVIVWSGASDRTIYGYANVNHAFRAWHDSLHIKLNADFSLMGEIRVAREQARLLRSDRLGAIVMAEVQGQAEYLARFGNFPIDQVEFVKQYLKG